MESRKEKDQVIRKLYQSENEKIYRFLRKWIPNQEEARDMVQDVFVNLILGIEEIRSLESITSWLFSTARFKALDFLKKKKTIAASDLKIATPQDMNDDDFNLFEWLSNHSPPVQDEQLWQEEVWKVINKTLQKLPEEQRSAFVLHELEGRSIKEIAEEANTSVNTILSRKRYAIIKLKESLVQLYNDIKK